MMNRKERRAAAARARSTPGVSSQQFEIMAIHEAGHAVGRYLTAADIGYTEDTAIDRIEVHKPGSMSAGTTKRGSATYSLSIAATTYGPMLSRRLGEIAEGLAFGEGGKPAPGPISMKTEDLFKELAARADAADIAAWLEARALYTVFGPVAEAAFTGRDPGDVLMSMECEHDTKSIIFDATTTGSTIAQAADLLNRAVTRAIEMAGNDGRIGLAIQALARAIPRSGILPGEEAAAIIRKALDAPTTPNQPGGETSCQ